MRDLYTLILMLLTLGVLAAVLLEERDAFDDLLVHEPQLGHEPQQRLHREPELTYDPTRVAVEVRGTALGDLEVSWKPSPWLPGDPRGLLPPAEAAKYVATPGSLRAWVEGKSLKQKPVRELEDVDWGEVVFDEELEAMWDLCKQHQALRSFVSDHYFNRAHDDWIVHQRTTPLQEQLQPALSFITAHVDDPDLWAAITAYSDDVAEFIHGGGDRADELDDPRSRWALLTLLSEAGSPPFEAVAQILLEGR